MRTIHEITTRMGQVKYPFITDSPRHAHVHFMAFNEIGQIDVFQGSGDDQSNKQPSLLETAVEGIDMTNGIITGYGGITTIEMGVRMIAAARKLKKPEPVGIVLQDANHFQSPFWEAFFEFYKQREDGNDLVDKFSMLTSDHWLRVQGRSAWFNERPSAVATSDLNEPFLQGDPMQPWYKDPVLFGIFMDLLNKDMVGSLTMGVSDIDRHDQLNNELRMAGGEGYRVVGANYTNIMHFFDLGTIPPASGAEGFYAGMLVKKELQMALLRNLLVTVPEGLILYAHDYPTRNKFAGSDIFELRVETTDEFKREIEKRMQGFTLKDVMEQVRGRT